MKNLNRKKPNQSGIALIVVLLILVVVSLLGIGGAQLAMMGERGARNERDAQVSRQYAEEALLDAELDIRKSARKDKFNSEMNFVDGCGTTGDLVGLCAQSLSGKPIWLTVNFEEVSATPHYTTFGTKTARTAVIHGSGLQPALAPRYIVEILPDGSAGVERGLKAPKKMLHRVTAMGFGPRPEIQTVLQTVFRKEKI